MMTYPGDELLRHPAQPVRALGIMGNGAAGRVAQAEMDMRAVADPVGIEDRREDRARTQAMRDGPAHLALDYGLVGGAHPRCRMDRDLVLPRTVFRQETVRRSPAARNAAI